MSRLRVALLGSTGFVGSEVALALKAMGHDVVPVSAPRLLTSARDVASLQKEAARSSESDSLAARLAEADVLVNAAGCPDASSLDEDLLFGANALLPAIAVEACRRSGVGRLIQVSSAVVQNDSAVLDASEVMRPFSPYSASKVAGELVIREGSSDELELVRYRPPSVHAPGRRVTRMVTGLASSPLASVAAPGDQPTPQALLPNVAAAIAFLAVTDLSPPQVVTHPSEGMTTHELMRTLGHREPRQVPLILARMTVRVLKALGTVHRPTAANARRIELLWLGQGQDVSWLEDSGWELPHGREGWDRLAKLSRGPQ